MDIYSVAELTKVNKSDIMQTYKFIFRVYNHTIENLLWSKDILSLLMSDTILSIFHIEIDATSVIISAIIKDQQHDMMSINDSILDAQDICCLYSMALIKFCNILPFYKYDVKKKSIIREKKKLRNSIAEVSKNLGIPEWLVECRHMACHTSSTSLILLRQACFIALSWLDKNFWCHFVDFKSSPKTYDFKSETQDTFNELMNNCSENHFLNRNSLLMQKIIRLSITNKKECFEMVVSILVSQDLIVNTFNISNGKIEGLKELKKFYEIIFLITENNPVSLIFDALINYFSSSNATHSRNAIFWFIILLKCLGNQEFSFSMDFKKNFSKNRNEFTKIEWIQLLYKVMINPNEYTNLIINLIVDFYPDLLSKHYMDLLSKLVRTLLYAEFSELRSQSDLKTLQDVLSAKIQKKE